MKTISDLSDDLIGEILTRVPITSLCALRSTCKKWNNLSKTQVNSGKKAAKNQPFLGFVLIDYKVCSLRFHLQGISNNKSEIFVDASVKQILKLEDVEISQVSQCDGLLLCVTKEDSSLIVWNPYLGQTRWIHHHHNTSYDSYVLGYDNNRNYKILGFLYDEDDQRTYQTEVYNFSSNTWRRVLDGEDGLVPFYHTGVSLKGKTYFVGREEDHLISFDFTTEKFDEQCLSLPFKPSLHPSYNTVTLSCVGDEKLAVLYYHVLYNPSERIKIWISTKIVDESLDEVKWKVVHNLNRRILPFDLPYYFGRDSFFIDEENKVAIVFQKGDRRACIIRGNRFVKYVRIGGNRKDHWDYTNLVGSSYVTSLLQLED